MKSLALILCLVVVVFSDESQEIWKKAHQECQQSEESKVPENIFESWAKLEKPILPDNFGLHVHCMAKKMDLQDEQGRILSDGLKRAIQREMTDEGQIDQIVATCSRIDKGNKQETALALMECLDKNKVVLGHL